MFTCKHDKVVIIWIKFVVKHVLTKLTENFITENYSYCYFPHPTNSKFIAWEFLNQ